MKKSVAISLIIVAVALAIVGFIYLPDVVAVQIGLTGDVSNTMAKPLAVIIPANIAIAGAIINIKDNNSKGTTLCVVGIIVQIVTLIFNLCL